MTYSIFRNNLKIIPYKKLKKQLHPHAKTPVVTNSYITHFLVVEGIEYRPKSM